MTIEDGRIEWEPTDLRRLMRFDCFGNVCAFDDPSEGGDATAVATVDSRRTPDWIAHPKAIRDLFARHREIRRTIAERPPEQAADVSTAGLLLFVEAKIITLIKCLIGVYNFFHVQDADEPGARYSTLLSDDPRNDIALVFVVMDGCLAKDDIRSSEARHVREHIDDAMKILFDMIASIASEGDLKSTHGSGLKKLREAYQSFHVSHPGKGNAFQPALALIKAFAKVSYFLADREGGWMKARPEPTLRRPAFGVKVKGVKYILNKIVAGAFDVGVNTILNWNAGRVARPHYYNGPYLATSEDEDRMSHDADLFRLHKANQELLLTRTKEKIEELVQQHKLPVRYADIDWKQLQELGIIVHCR